jgi:hypothetical protein
MYCVVLNNDIFARNDCLELGGHRYALFHVMEPSELSMIDCAENEIECRLIESKYSSIANAYPSLICKQCSVVIQIDNAMSIDELRIEEVKYDEFESMISIGD